MAGGLSAVGKAAGRLKTTVRDPLQGIFGQLAPLHKGFDSLSERTSFVCEPTPTRAVQQIGSCPGHRQPVASCGPTVADWRHGSRMLGRPSNAARDPVKTSVPRASYPRLPTLLCNCRQSRHVIKIFMIKWLLIVGGIWLVAGIIRAIIDSRPVDTSKTVIIPARQLLLVLSYTVACATVFALFAGVYEIFEGSYPAPDAYHSAFEVFLFKIFMATILVLLPVMFVLFTLFRTVLNPARTPAVPMILAWNDVVTITPVGIRDRRHSESFLPWRAVTGVRFGAHTVTTIEHDSGGRFGEYSGTRLVVHKAMTLELDIDPDYLSPFGTKFIIHLSWLKISRGRLRNICRAYVDAAYARAPRVEWWDYDPLRGGEPLPA
jgi:hypothetical protein